MKATTSAEHEARRPQSPRPACAHSADGARCRTRRLATSGRWFAALLALLFGLGIALPDADAQSKRRKKRRRGRRGKAAKVDRKPDKPRPSDAPDSGATVAIEDRADDDPPRGDDDGGKRSGKGARATTRETKGAQVFDFTGLELGGQLRMPQLLYFLDRANEELQKASLEKRSFIPEMARSLDEERL